VADRLSGHARVYVHTLGCPKNEADSRSVGRALGVAGVEVVERPEEATHILLNTCGFIREAKEESIAGILDLATSYPEAQLLVMGCLVERYRGELAAGIPEVAGWFGLAGGEDQKELLRLLGGGSGRDGSGREPRALVSSSRCAIPRRRSYAYVKISDGCDELCSFCAIPGIKGPYRAEAPEEILRDAGACLEDGAKELVLVGQDTARWESRGLDLIGLADLLVADRRLERLRIMYLQPEHVTTEFLEYMGRQEKLCHYLDIPLQHSHPQVLRRMGRTGDGDSYLELLATARKLIPDVALRSAFIVGFPGETEEQFEHLLGFVREAGFDYAGGFIYSPEEGTPACRLKPSVPRRVARERLNRLDQVLAEVAEHAHRRHVGVTMEVMVDSLGDDDPDEGPEAVGRVKGQAPEVDGVVYVEGRLPDGIGVGGVISVEIEATIGYDFAGTVVES
jgi:ribosomal protein S12 methylthiotransferase